MGKDFRVVINHPERRLAFERALGTHEVYVRTPIPELARLPGYPDGAPVFMLDLAQYSHIEIGRLADEVAAKWNLPRDEVLDDIVRGGIPILDEDCSVVIHNPQRWPG